MCMLAHHRSLQPIIPGSLMLLLFEVQSLPTIAACSPVGRPATLWTTPLVPRRGRGMHPGSKIASHTLRQVTKESTEKAPLVLQREAASHSGHCDKMRPCQQGQQYDDNFTMLSEEIPRW
jgi:hypothetical protein